MDACCCSMCAERGACCYKHPGTSAQCTARTADKGTPRHACVQLQRRVRKPCTQQAQGMQRMHMVLPAGCLQTAWCGVAWGREGREGRAVLCGAVLRAAATHPPTCEHGEVCREVRHPVVGDRGGRQDRAAQHHVPARGHDGVHVLGHIPAAGVQG